MVNEFIGHGWRKVILNFSFLLMSMIAYLSLVTSEAIRLYICVELELEKPLAIVSDYLGT